MQNDESYLGFGPALDDGDLVLENGDLAFVTGFDTVAQAVEIAVLTQYGADPFNITYGLDYRSVFAGSESYDEAKDRLRLELVRTVAGDARVADIAEIAFSDEPGFARLFPDTAPPPPESRVLLAALAVSLAQGEALGVALPVEVPQ